MPIYIILKWQVIYNAWKGDLGSGLGLSRVPREYSSSDPSILPF